MEATRSGLESRLPPEQHPTCFVISRTDAFSGRGLRAPAALRCAPASRVFAGPRGPSTLGPTTKIQARFQALTMTQVQRARSDEPRRHPGRLARQAERTQGLQKKVGAASPAAADCQQGNLRRTPLDKDL